jgi:hypothetical protein
MNMNFFFKHLSFLACILSLCISFLASGCDSPRTEIIGQWGVDLSAIAQSEELKKVSPPARQITKDWKLNMMRDWYFSFDANQNLEMKYQGAHYKGNYQITKIIQRVVYIRARMTPIPQNEIDALLGISAPENLNVVEEQFLIRFRGGQVILEIPELEPLVLRREKALQM